MARSDGRSELSVQTTSEGVDDSDHLPNALVLRRATHQVAGSGCSATPQMSHRFVALQESLASVSPLQAAAVP